MSVVSMQSGRMTEADYDRERAKIREAYGDNRQSAGARAEQALASLFYRSGWTQSDLAAKEGRAQSWVSRKCLFGRFLGFMPVGINAAGLPQNLSERVFRSYWNRTDKTEINERARFRAVESLMAEETILSRPHAKKGFGEDIRKRFADGKWHRFETIAAAVDGPADDVLTTLDIMRLRGTYRVKCERKKVGAEYQYRIFPKDRTVSSRELITKLSPLVEGLKAEGKKNMATMSPGTVAHLAALIQKLLDEWEG